MYTYLVPKLGIFLARYFGHLSIGGFLVKTPICLYPGDSNTCVSAPHWGEKEQKNGLNTLNVKLSMHLG